MLLLLIFCMKNLEGVFLIMYNTSFKCFLSSIIGNFDEISLSFLYNIMFSLFACLFIIKTNNTTCMSFTQEENRWFSIFPFPFTFYVLHIKVHLSVWHIIISLYFLDFLACHYAILLQQKFFFHRD